jgi:hypothetical protein
MQTSSVTPSLGQCDFTFAITRDYNQPFHGSNRYSVRIHVELGHLRQSVFYRPPAVTVMELGYLPP